MAIRMIWTNESRNSATFTNPTKSDSTTFGALTNDQIGSLSNDDILQGRAVGEYANDDVVSSTIFSNESRNTASWSNETRNS